MNRFLRGVRSSFESFANGHTVDHLHVRLRCDIHTYFAYMTCLYRSLHVMSSSTSSSSSWQIHIVDCAITASKLLFSFFTMVVRLLCPSSVPHSDHLLFARLITAVTAITFSYEIMTWKSRLVELCALRSYILHILRVRNGFVKNENKTLAPRNGVVVSV